jgi:hypothetical protein
MFLCCPSWIGLANTSASVCLSLLYLALVLISFISFISFTLMFLYWFRFLATPRIRSLIFWRELQRHHRLLTLLPSISTVPSLTSSLCIPYPPPSTFHHRISLPVPLSLPFKSLFSIPFSFPSLEYSLPRLWNTLFPSFINLIPGKRREADEIARLDEAMKQVIAKTEEYKKELLAKKKQLEELNVPGVSAVEWLKREDWWRWYPGSQ